MALQPFVDTWALTPHSMIDHLGATLLHPKYGASGCAPARGTRPPLAGRLVQDAALFADAATIAPITYVQLSHDKGSRNEGTHVGQKHKPPHPNMLPPLPPVMSSLAYLGTVALGGYLFHWDLLDLAIQ